MALAFKKLFNLKVASLLILVALLIPFQNCGKVEVVDLLSEQKAEEAEALALERGEEKVVIGLSQVPDLKMFFIVDNSGTMQANRLNLSDSFKSFFEQNQQDSLYRFKTTSYLLSTAQVVPLGNSPEQIKNTYSPLALKQAKYNVGSSVSQAEFNTEARTPSLNTGRVAGDNIGFRVSESADGTEFQFLPAEVLGGRPNGASLLLSSGITKPALSSPAPTEAEFKSLLSVLDSNRVPQVNVNGTWFAENSDTIDKESGLCAAARILRDPANFLKDGDVSSFHILSDENDNDPSGKSCIRSVKNWNGTEDLVGGFCEERSTNFELVTTTPRDDIQSCNFSGALRGYGVKVSYPQGQTKISFLAVQNYERTAFRLSYDRNESFGEWTRTSARYTKNICVDKNSDGIVTKVCTPDTKETTIVFNGAISQGECSARVKQSDASALETSQYPIFCELPKIKEENCPANSSAYCITKVRKAQSPGVVDIVGLNNEANCQKAASGRSDYVVGSKPNCVNIASNFNNTVCSQAEISEGSCKRNTVARNRDVSDIVANGAPCLQYVQSRFSDQASVNVSDVTCVASSVNKDLNFELSFSESNSADNGQTLAVNNTSCGPLKALALAKARAQDSAVPETAACGITYLASQSLPSQALNPASNCAAQAKLECDSKSLRSCTGVLSVQKQNPTTAVSAAGIINEELSCDSKCGDSALGFCGGGVSAQTTIRDFIKSKGSGGAAATYDCKSSKGATAKLNSLNDVLNSQAATVCAKKLDGTPRYFVRTSGPYRKKGTSVEYVAGTNAQGEPAMNLVDFIKAKNQELTKGESYFSVFVRRPGDPLGNGGSFGTEYEKLVQQTSGSIGSILAPDYSDSFKAISKSISRKLTRTLKLEKMKPYQAVVKVFRTPANSGVEAAVDPKLWVQKDKTVVINDALEINEGDQFRMIFENRTQNQ